jgi:uncharacterized YccA/Bax inhibitor family protein
MKEGNPVFGKMTSERAFSGSTMTVEGTVNRTGLLLLPLFATALWSYNAGVDVAGPWMLTGALVGFVIALITIFNPRVSPFTAPVYAACEGLALGGLSALADMQYPGVAFQAVLATAGVLAIMLTLYSNRVIRVTDKFFLGVVAATGGICLLYFMQIILSFFGIQIPIVESHSWYGILFSVGVVVVAALNLTLDFHMIEEGVNNGSPKYMEWYGAFGLLVTLVWLYLEVLRLFQKLKED